MAEINNSQRKKIVKVGLLETFAELVDTLYGSPMGASGTNHAPGLVPDPGATAGSSKFLCEDGTWKEPSGGGGSSVSIMGASGTNHASGLVPDPGATAGTTKFLREDGTWQIPIDENTQYTVATESVDGLMSKEDKTKLNGYPSKTNGSSKFLREDGTWLTPPTTGGGGGGSASVMGGSGENHAAGLVPDPGATAGTTKFLREDGTWNVPVTPALSTMIDLEAQTYESSINSNGHDYVEIGGVKWATMNIGANSITDTGLYFQWGDTQGYTASQCGNGEGQKYFGWADYKYNNGTSTGNNSTMTKYNATDGKTVLDPSDDAVTAAWGGDWVTPTASEINALISATSQSLVNDYQNSGVSGVLFTDKTDNSKTLFFPFTGYLANGNIHNSSNYCMFMTKEHDFANTYNLNDFVIISSSSLQLYVTTYYRYYGVCVRGVLGTTINTNKVLLKNYTWGNLNNKEDCVLIKESSDSSICPNVGEYYNITNTVTSLTIRLPAITQNFKKLQEIIINFTTGNSPSVTISSLGGKIIKYFSDYAIEGGKTYELNCMWNGTKWIIAYGIIS